MEGSGRLVTIENNLCYHLQPSESFDPLPQAQPVLLLGESRGRIVDISGNLSSIF